MQRIKLGDGIFFNMLEQYKFKTNTFQVAFVVDLERENTTKLSLLTGILFKASEKYPDVAAINNRLDYLYDMSAAGYTYKRGERLIFCYESEFLKNDCVPNGGENLSDEAIEMFRQLVFRPLLVDGGFDEELLSVEKNQLEKEINSIINNKNAYLKKKCTEAMCAGEKYGINADGEIEDIPAADGKNLYEFYCQLLKTARIEVFFNGEGNAEDISKKFKDVFSLIEKREPIKLCDNYVTGKAKDTVLELTEEMPVSQGKLAIGFRTGVSINDDDAVSLTLLNEIFGASPVSKLFMNVREKLSLCYYCRSVPDSYKGVMFVLSGIESENRDKAFNAIMKELSDIKEGKITDDETEAARLSVLTAYKTLDDNPSAICSWYLSRIICDNFEEPSDIIEKVKAVTRENVVAVAKKIKLDTVCFLKGTGTDKGTEEE